MEPLLPQSEIDRLELSADERRRDYDREVEQAVKVFLKIPKRDEIPVQPMKTKDWDDLARWIDTLTPEQRKQPISIVSGYNVFVGKSVSISEEDYLKNKPTMIANFSFNIEVASSF